MQRCGNIEKMWKLLGIVCNCLVQAIDMHLLLDRGRWLYAVDTLVRAMAVIVIGCWCSGCYLFIVVSRLLLQMLSLMSTVLLMLLAAAMLFVYLFIDY